MAQLPAPHRSPQSRAGRTLAEQLIVLVVTGLLLALAVTPGLPLLDRIAVTTATQEIVDILGTARDLALARQQLTAVRITAQARRLAVHAGVDTLARTVLPDGVRLESTRDSLAYAPNGLGYGAANLRIVVSRGQATDTITISRLGRVSHN
jgi:Tfp pilus assembly protein FimT